MVSIVTDGPVPVGPMVPEKLPLVAVKDEDGIGSVLRVLMVGIPVPGTLLLLAVLEMEAELVIAPAVDEEGSAEDEDELSEPERGSRGML